MAETTVTIEVDSVGIRVYTSFGDPINIGDNKTVSSSIIVSGPGPRSRALTIRINLTHASPSDLTAQLISSTGSTLTIDGPIVSGDYVHEYVVAGAMGPPLDGTWTLQGNRQRQEPQTWLADRVDNDVNPSDRGRRPSSPVGSRSRPGPPGMGWSLIRPMTNDPLANPNVGRRPGPDADKSNGSQSRASPL